MNGAWAVRLPRSQAQTAAALRLRAEVLVCPLDDVLWLRGPELSDDIDLALRKLPGAERFTLDADGTITPLGRRIPGGKIPAQPWQPLGSWIVPAPQPAALAGEVCRRASLRLVRATSEEPASLLVTSLGTWVDYATSAPLVRLRPLRFAVAQDGRVLVRGAPPPSIPGRRYVERGGIGIPCGFALWPAVDAESLRALFGTNASDLVLFDPQGGWERIDADAFVAATRASVRATAEAVQSHG